jgi:hypothetical protein
MWARSGQAKQRLRRRFPASSATRYPFWWIFYLLTLSGGRAYKLAMKTKTLAAIIFTLTVFALISNIKADIIILQYGDIVTGKIIQTNENGIDIQQNTGKVHWPASMVKEVRKEVNEPTTNRIPSWVKIISQLTTNEWAHDFKQIPATVIDNGVLKDVPYISFRCNTGGYEINVYGDLDNPACIEIGTVGYLVKNNQAKSNCVNFISSVLPRDMDKAAVRNLNWKPKDLKQSNGLTFETTLPDEADSYGGWWISVYNAADLTNAQASGAELEAITQPKIKPKVIIPVAAPMAAPSANYWSDNDISTYSRPSARESSHGGDVYVRGYYRANGTYVSSYTRRSPSR